MDNHTYINPNFKAILQHFSCGLVIKILIYNFLVGHPYSYVLIFLLLIRLTKDFGGKFVK